MNWKVILLFGMSLLIAGDVFAIGRRRRYTYNRTTTTYRSSGPANLYSGTDQERCFAEAAYMAANGIRRHVGATIGRFEGWGYGGPNCATCTPRSGMSLTGDAWVGGIRVRSWR